jgi:hypothetical protein
VGWEDEDIGGTGDGEVRAEKFAREASECEESWIGMDLVLRFDWTGLERDV